MKTICVFCSANELHEEYSTPAKKLAELIAASNYDLLWGGTDTGLMRVVARTAQQNGARVIGISTELFRHKAMKEADEMIFTKNLADRKQLMLMRSDAIVVLVGGTGTLDEITEILELKKHGVHNKPIIFLNTNDFYAGLKSQFQIFAKEGFLNRSINELVYFCDHPEEVISLLKSEEVGALGFVPMTGNRINLDTMHQ